MQLFWTIWTTSTVLLLLTLGNYTPKGIKIKIIIIIELL